MTEAEWLACEDSVTLRNHVLWSGSDRKLRLFAVACCREVWSSLVVDAVRAAVETSERFADKLVDEQELTSVRNAAHGPAHTASVQSRRSGVPTEEMMRRLFFAVYMSQAPVNLRHDHMPLLRTDAVLRIAAPPLLRDIFGNPFRPVAFNPAWRTSDVLALARGIYDEKAFERMPILADALQDAGCDSDDILNHCRDASQVHVRGCWVVDLVLGKE